MGPSTSIIELRKCPTILPVLWEHFSQFLVLSSQTTLACIGLTKQLEEQKIKFILKNCDGIEGGLP